METKTTTKVLQLLSILQSGQHYTPEDFAGILGTSRRTVFRYLRILRESNITYHWDAKSKYYTLDMDLPLPGQSLSTQEALGLLLLTFRARNHIQLPFGNSALQAAIKIENILPEATKRYCNTVLRSISVKCAPHAKMILLDRIFVQLMEAILKKRIVNIRYSLSGKSQSLVTDLSPYHLRYSDYRWCVIGESSLHRQVRTIEFDRIKEVKVLNKCFVENRDFDVNEYLGKAWSAAPEGRLYHIMLRVSPEAAHDVAGVQWHSTQKAVYKADGSAIVEFRVDGLNEIMWWILSFGNKVHVIEPKILREKIAELVQNMTKQNG